ncbi:MAG: DUF72 domain-containing protein, partial [Spirochaetia bacterium]|nr:DUF72 domain-containing protein [Spirochaetia bacterium]
MLVYTKNKDIAYYELYFYSISMENPLFGTCSFIYPSWKDLVYSSSNPPNYLAEYSQKYQMVEIDRWFWSLGKKDAGLPHPQTVIDYHNSTDSHFRFTIKCPNALTLPFYPGTTKKNPYYLNSTFMESFIDSLIPIKEKIGLLMFQFGYINKEMSPRLSSFIESLSKFFNQLDKTIPYGVEIRNPSFLT